MSKFYKYNMKNSKLLEIIATFTGHDWNAYRDLVHSPYFNKNKELCDLAEYLYQHRSELGEMHREVIFKALFPKKAYDDKKMNYLLSFLLKLSEQYIGLQVYEQKGKLPEIHTIQALGERGITKNYKYLYLRTHQTLENLPSRNAEIYLQQLQLAVVETSFQIQYPKEVHLAAQLADIAVDCFYLSEKLRIACDIASIKKAMAAPIETRLIEEIFVVIDRNPELLEVPSINIYLRLFKMLSDSVDEATFDEFINLLDKYNSHFPLTEMWVIYEYSINFCALEIRKGRDLYLKKVLDLYEKGIDNKVLLKKGKLSPWHYKNIIKLGLRLKRWTWTEQFIIQVNPLLESSFRNDALYYNLADLYYYMGDYDKAMSNLLQIEFHDLQYNIDSKKILAKIYTETKAYDALDSLLHAFKTFLIRNKVLAEEAKQTYLNFIKALTMIINSRKDQKNQVKQKIELMTVITDKNWLLRQLE